MIPPFEPPLALRKIALRQEVAALRPPNGMTSIGRTSRLLMIFLLPAVGLVLGVILTSLLVSPTSGTILGVALAAPVGWYWIIVSGWLRETMNANDAITQYALLERREAELSSYDA
ncbi:hypothetical protein JQC91_15480 [Jannaschia sp. Os4]|uniref:hypothetical protein n=1 Tax=Jannaschia sp. Os4 TaxID=2807617 RepID=UPI00193ADD41|nr:hypothetical protein [Jannaschia sp. Os4]MBM2577708.1 hypothetical protein [Jannaschia sp. Os4]